MNDIVYTKSYEDYKLEVGTELSKASESFVRIGYLLKVARDTTILQGTEYEGNYVKFAEAEFGLEKTQVSRFIRINDKFSVDGNSPELIEQYKGFGTRKLGIMLLLPDELTEEERHYVTLKITKGRFGGTGREVDLYFNGETMTYTQLMKDFVEVKEDDDPFYEKIGAPAEDQQQAGEQLSF